MVMNMYAIYILGKKYKEFKSLEGYEKHLLRLQNTPNADPSKLKENMILKGQEKSIVENIKEFISKCKIRSNNVIVRDLLLSASREFFQDNNLEKRYNWVKANVRFLEENFGDNYRFGIVHCDEETIHIHALICPRFEDKQGIKVLSNERYFGGKRKLIEWQDKYAEAMKEFELKRGVQYSRCDHRDIKNFYAYVDHMEEIEDISNIDPKFVMTQNLMLKTRVSGLEETLQNYQKYLRLEKEAHKKTIEEKDQVQEKELKLQKENKEIKQKNIDYGFMIDCCLEYLAEEKHMTKKDINKLVELAVSKGDKLNLENIKEVEKQNYYGKIDFYSNTGEIAETIKYKNKEEYEKEIRDSLEVGRYINPKVFGKDELKFENKKENERGLEYER